MSFEIYFLRRRNSKKWTHFLQPGMEEYNLRITLTTRPIGNSSDVGPLGGRPSACIIHRDTISLIHETETFRNASISSRRIGKTSRKVEMARVAGVVKIKRSWCSKERANNSPIIYIYIYIFLLLHFPADGTI